MALDGKTAIVTGGASGVGKAIVRRFLADGAAVVIADHDEIAGAATLEEFRSLGEISFFAADVSESLDVHNLVAETLDAQEAVDIMVNGAGITRPAAFLDLHEDAFDEVMRVNLKGTFLCAQAAARTMARRVEEGGPAGTIINISSVDARLVQPDHLPYCVSKAGIAQLTAAMAVALAPLGIRVNAVGPGSVRGDPAAPSGTDREAQRRILSRTPLGRIGEPEEIAGVAAFLASDDAGYVTGQTIYADGGRLPLNYTVPVAK